jgi:FG-GAP repeat
MLFGGATVKPIKAATLVLMGAVVAFGLLSPETAWAEGTQPAIVHPSQVLSGTDTVAGDNFGQSVAMSGNTMVVGAIGHASQSGRAYVFTKTVKGWQQTAELNGSGAWFGDAVALSGSTIVVTSGRNSIGRADIFSKTASGWRQTAVLTAPSTSHDTGFGQSVGISTDTIVVGGVHALYVFTEEEPGWRLLTELKGSGMSTPDFIDDSLAISGGTIVLGAPGSLGSPGRAYVFADTPQGWRQTAELGQPGTAAGDRFGAGVAAMPGGRTIVIANEPLSFVSPQLYVFTTSPTGWHLAAALQAFPGVTGPLALSAATVVGTGLGVAYVFRRSAGGWSESAELSAPGVVTNDDFGWSVAISGDTVAISAPYVDSKAGRVYLFDIG